MSAWAGSQNNPDSRRHKAAQATQRPKPVHRPSVLDVALALAAEGWPVFPCTAKKKPAISEAEGGRGYLDAVTDPEAVRRLFARAPHARLVGVPTGVRTNLIVIDIDPRHQGDVWEAEKTDQLPDTLIHSTQSGGRHWVFQYVEGIRGRTNCPAPGVDVRAEGNYIIMPPSTGYAVINDAEIAPCPAWLLDGIRRSPIPPRPFVKTDPGEITDKRLDGIVRSLLARISNAPEGLKHETLRSTAITLGGYAHLLPHSDDQLIALAVGALPDTVLDWDNARKTAAWGIAEGRKRPLQLEDRPYHRANGNGTSPPPSEPPDADPVTSGVPPEPEPPTRGTRIGRLLVLSVDDTDTAVPRDYLMKGLISPGEISIWVGPPKCGKSFLLLYVAYMLSLGRSVFGRRVKPTKVLYVAAEGEAGIVNRIRALRIKHGRSENFHFIAQPADLLHDAGHKAELIEAARAFGAQLIVLDTLSRLLAGGDENSPIDMGCFVRNVAELRHDTNAHIAIVHHGTKASNGSNPRGHSLLTGADDALIEVLKLDDGSRTATVIHAKDDADGMRWGFKLDPVELGTDDDGDPITTLLTTELAEPPAAAERERLSDNLRIGLQTLHAAMKAHGTLATVGEDHAEQSVVTEANWRAWFYREGKPGESQDTKKKAFQRIVDGLQAKGLIGSRDGFIWPIARAQ